MQLDLPRRFSYRPRLLALLPLLTIGIVPLVAGIFHVIRPGVGIAVGFLLLSLIVFVLQQWFIAPGFIELQQHMILIRAGAIRRQIIKIPYAEIAGSSEFMHGNRACFIFRASERTIEINSVLLADQSTYFVIRDFLKSRIPPPGPPPPPLAGAYTFRCSDEGNGEIYNTNGDVIWRTRTEHSKDFVVYDQAEREVLRVKRKSRRLFSPFTMFKEGVPVCAIRLCSIFVNKYTMEFADGRHWVFRMPLFSVCFSGASDSGETIRVRLWSHNQWYVLIEAKAENPQLVATLAFIHRERLRLI